MKRLLTLLLLAGLAFGQSEYNGLAGTYMDNESLDMLALEVSGTGYARAMYSHAGAPFEPIPGGQLRYQTTDSSNMVLLTQHPDGLGMELVFTRAMTTLLQAKMANDGERNFVILNSEADTSLRPLKIAEERMAGTYYDYKSGELMLVTEGGSRWRVYYSNGRKPWAEMQNQAEEPNRLRFTAAFATKPAERYPVRLLIGPIGQSLYVQNPDGTEQYFELLDRQQRPKEHPSLLLHKYELIPEEGGAMKKPVTYLYPEYAMPVQVKLDEQIPLLESYPPYPAGGWQVTATPDGRVLTPDGREYSYLFWDTRPLPTAWDQTTGRVLRRDQVLPYLQQALPEMGLTPREYNEFIVYWLPVLKETEWVQLDWAVYHTQDGQDLSNPNGRLMHAQAGLHISPVPQTLFRLMLLYRPAEGPKELKELPLPYLHRRGFTVVEWGGTRMGPSEVGME